jgi:tetratricopeptide (TPR) repeat protein
MQYSSAPTSAGIPRFGDRGHGPWVVLSIMAVASTVDDAFISYRYAENLVAGHGLVFNIGERVEGYTNFLWTLMLATAHAIGADTEVSSQVLGLAFGVALLPVVYATAHRLLGFDRWLALVPCALLAGNPAIARWAGSGLETVAYATLFTLGISLAIRDLRDDPRLPLSGFAAGLAALTRPEAAALFGVFWIGSAILVRGRARVLGFMAIAFASLTLPHLAFRLYYYGLPLPNTYYAKVTTSADTLTAGLAYVGDFFIVHGPWALVAIVGLLWFRVAAFSYVAAVGGDFYELWRFCVPYLPWLVLLVLTGAKCFGARFAQDRSGRPRMELLVTLAVAISILVPAKVWPMASGRVVAEDWALSNQVLEELGLWLKDSYPDSTVIAVTWLGRVPYFSRFRAIDMLGIADAHIARVDPPTPTIVTPTGRRFDISTRAGVAGHGKYDPDYVLAREPDLVAIEFTARNLESATVVNDLRTQLVFEVLVRAAVGPALPSLVARADFRRNYVPRVARVSPESVFVYFERDQALARLEEAVQEDFDDPSLHFELALQYRLQGLLPEAVASIERAVALNPGHLPSQLNRGYFLLEAERPKAAIAAFQQIVSAHEGEGTALYGLALAHYQAGEYGPAIGRWSEFLRRFPSHPYTDRAAGLIVEARRRAGSL